MASKPLRTAVFPVAGRGTRFLPATKATPKEMLPVVDRPLIQYAVDEAIEAGIEQMIFVTGRNKTAIEDHFDIAFELETVMKERGKSLEVLEATRLKPGACAYVRQQEPLGLGHAVWCARRSEEHTSELQSLMRISYAVFCLNKKTTQTRDSRGGYHVATQIH